MGLNQLGTLSWGRGGEEAAAQRPEGPRGVRQRRRVARSLCLSAGSPRCLRAGCAAGETEAGSLVRRHP